MCCYYHLSYVPYFIVFILHTCLLIIVMRTLDMLWRLRGSSLTYLLTYFSRCCFGPFFLYDLTVSTMVLVWHLCA